MHRIEKTPNVGGLFGETPPNRTPIGADWLNAIQEEIAYVIEQAGLTLNLAEGDTRIQLLAALNALYLAGGLIVDASVAAGANIDPTKIGDESDNAATMQANTDPYPLAVASLATTLQGEILRIRYLIKQITGETHWYIDPDNNLATLESNQNVIETWKGNITASTTEINQLNTLAATTISANQWALLGGLSATLTAAEINQLNTLAATTISANQWALLGGLSATLTAAEINQLNTLAATTISAAQWALLGGMGTTAAELSQLENIAATTISAAQWALLGGLSATLTAAEINQLNTLAATTISANQWAMLGGVAETLGFAELNYNDITTLGTSQNSKVLTQSAAGVIVIGATGADETIDIASHDGVDGGLKLAGTLITVSAAEINGITATSHALTGDATAGRIIRRLYLTIKDGTDANTIECTVEGSAFGWNGDAIGATNNIIKNGTTGDFTLNAAGTDLYIEASGLTGNCVDVIACNIARNETGTPCELRCHGSTNDIHLTFTDLATGADIDLTALMTGTDQLNSQITYITDA